jgi:signal transduction histidine kinase
VIDRRSLRVRLTTAFVALCAVLVIAGYIGAAWLLDRAVWEPLDAALAEEAVGLDLLQPNETGFGDGAGIGLRSTDADKASRDFAEAVRRLGSERDLGPDKFVVVSSAAGRTIAAAGHLPAAAATAAGAETAQFLSQGASRYRIVSHRIGRDGSVVIGVRVDSQVRMLRRARVALAIGALGLLVGVGVLAWSITTRTTREMEDVTTELESLEADTVSRRLTPRTMTEVARLTDALNRLLARVEQAQRRLQRFTADAAHELRTPLAALRATLDTAVARPTSLEGDRNALFDAIEQTERLGALADDLLTLSSIESADPPTPTSVHLGNVATEVAEFLEPVASEQQRHFVVEVDGDAIVLGEAPLLRRLLLNLLGNAFTHTAQGVSVHLVVRQCDREIELVIRDGGEGIAPGVQRLLFERFAGPPRRGGGAGLGLAICREIVTRHHGTIALDSGPQGTCVTVRFPAAKAGRFEDPCAIRQTGGRTRRARRAERRPESRTV